MSPWEQQISCYRPLRSQRKKFIIWKIFVKLTLRTIKICISTFAMSDIKRKKAQNLFFTGNIAFFFKKMYFQQPLKSWWNDHNFCKVIVTLASELIQTVYLGLLHSIIGRRKAKNFSSLERLPLFIKKLCFQQPLRSWRKDHSFSTVIVKLASGLKETVPWGLSNSNIPLKTGQKLFSLENLPIFQKTLFSSTSQYLKKWSCNFHSVCQTSFWTLKNWAITLVK